MKITLSLAFFFVIFLSITPPISADPDPPTFQCEFNFHEANCYVDNNPGAPHCDDYEDPNGTWQADDAACDKYDGYDEHGDDYLYECLDTQEEQLECVFVPNNPDSSPAWICADPPSACYNLPEYNPNSPPSGFDAAYLYGPGELTSHQAQSNCNTYCNTVEEEEEEEAEPIQWELCNQAGDNIVMQMRCDTCHKNGGIWTAVGCIQTSQQGIAKGITTVLISVAGGFALLLILYGAFTITTAQANPERLQNGRAILTSAIIGLVFILLSVVILRFLGISILQLPGFG